MDVIAGKYFRNGDPGFVAEDLIDIWSEREQSMQIQDDLNPEPLDEKTLRAIQPPGFLRSFYVFAYRSSVQLFLRGYHQLVFDVGLEAFAGIIVGVLYTNVSFVQLRKFLFMETLGLGLTMSIASLRVFGNERIIYWRECAPGAGMNLNRFGYFMAKNFIELPRLLLLSFFFSMAFIPIVTPIIPWYYLMLINWAGAFAVSGVSVFASIAFDPLSAQLFVVIFVLINSMFSGLSTSISTIMENPFYSALMYTSYARWLAELLYLDDVYFLSLAWRMPPNWYKSESEYSALYGCITYEYVPTAMSMDLCILSLVWLGIFFRFIGYLSLLVFNRDKMGQSTVTQMAIYFILNPCDDCWKSMRRSTRSGSPRRSRPSRSASPNSHQSPLLTDDAAIVEDGARNARASSSQNRTSGEAERRRFEQEGTAAAAEKTE